MVELAIVFPCLVQNDFWDTALVAAVDKGHLHVAEILVKNGADVNYRNKVRALIPVTQVCIMWPMIRHGIMVNQWDVQALWIVTVGHRLKSDQHGSLAARTTPGRAYGCLTIACQYSLQCACVLIVLADGGQ